MVAQDGHVDWDDYYNVYEVIVTWMGKVEPYGNWHEIQTYSYMTKELPKSFIYQWATDDN